MNDNNFNNEQPMNNQNMGMPMGPQPNPNMTGQDANMNAGMDPNMGMSNMNPGVNPAMGMPEANMNVNPNMPMPNMNAGMDSNMGVPNMNPGVNPNMGMPMGTQPYPGMPMGGQPVQKKPMNLPLIIGIAVGGIAVVILILFLTGVIGGKKLTCTKEESYMGMNAKEELVISFKDDKPSKITTRQTIDYGTNTTYKEYIKEGFDEELEYAKEQGYDAKITSTDTSYTLTMTIGKDDIPDNIGDEETSFENIKEYYEDLEYTCK